MNHDDDGEVWVRCSECGGTGQLEYPDPPDGHTTHTGSCMDCDGRGIRMGTLEDVADGAERVDYP